MQAEKNIKANPGKLTKAKILGLILAIVAVLIVLLLMLLPVFISSEKCRQMILAKINSSVDGRADFSDLSMGWLKGIKISNLSFTDNIGATFIEVKQITTQPHYLSFLSGDFYFGQTIIEQPRVTVNLAARQIDVNRPAEPKAQPIFLPATKIDLVINDGNIKITDSKANTLQLAQIDSKLSLRPPGQQTTFNLSTNVVEQDKVSRIHTAGTIRPTKNGWNLKGTSGDVTIEIGELALESLEPILELAGVELQTKGLLSANAQGEIKDGRLEKLTAQVTAQDLNITGAQLKGDRLHTSAFELKAHLQQEKELIRIDEFELRSDWASMTADGTIPLTFKSLTDILAQGKAYNLTSSFDCDLGALLSQIPNTLGVKEEIKVTRGKLSGSLDTVTEAGKATIQGQAAIADLAGTVDDKELALSEPLIASLEMTADKEIIKLDKLNVSSAFAQINAGGDLGQINYNTDIDLAKFQSELGQFINIGYTIGGKITGKGQISLEEDIISTTGETALRELHVASADGNSVSEPKAELDFDLHINKSKRIVTVQSAQAITSFGSINIENAIVPFGEEPTEPMNMVVSAKQVSLEKLKPFMVLFASFPKKVQIAGMAESQIRINSKNGNYIIVTDATKIKNFKLVSANKKPFEQQEVTLLLDAEINPKEKAIDVKKLQLESPQIKIKKGEFKKVSQGNKTKLQGAIECEYDWAAISDAASVFLPEGLEVQGQRKAVIEFKSEYPSDKPQELMANLSGKAKVGFEKANYMGLDSGPTEVDIRIENGLLDIAPFSTTVNNGQLSFAGQADFKQKPTILKTPQPIQIAKDIQINKETSEKLFMYVNPIFANAVNISGVANFHCERLALPLASDAKDQLEVIGTISANNLRMQTSDLLGQILSVTGVSPQGQVITIHPTRFVLQKGILRYDNMQVDIGDKPINFKGTIGLDKSLDMTVTLPYTFAGRTARVGAASTGERISLPLSGTINKPKLDMSKLLEQQLQQQLFKGLEGLLK